MEEKPPEKIIREEIMVALKAMKPEKTAGRFEVCAEMIPASGEVGKSMMMEIFQQVVLDGRGISGEWQTSVLVSIFKTKGDLRNYNECREVKLLAHAMTIVERLERKIQELLNVTMQLGFMPGRGTTDALSPSISTIS